MKIYDCFLFFNELDLLEVRLHELDPYVDYFVIVESEESFTGKSKPLYFNINRKRYTKFLDKIIHVKVERKPGLSDWSRQHHQRNCIKRGLTGCDPDDVILVSDLDEIPRGELIRSNLPENKQVIDYMLRYYGHVLNRRIFRTNPRYKGPEQDFISGTKSVRYSYFTSAEKVLRLEGEYKKNSKKILDAGSHLSWMGDMDHILHKAGSVSGPTDVKNPKKSTGGWLDRTRKMRYNGIGLFGVNHLGFTMKKVPIDSSYPKYILDNLDKFDSWIYKGEVNEND